MTLPARLGKYTISEVLGTGAMGVVYKGFDPDIHRSVALKTIRKDLIHGHHEEALAARFRNEARAAGRLSHPGIVSVYEYGEDAEVAFLAMEFIEGNPLREYFDRGATFEPADAVSIMAQLLDALAHAHEFGVWHRDIKPANVIISTTGRLKVADFGIARIETSDLTQTGAIMGTPGYMAPEQFQGAEVDGRADLFSAGVVLYQLLTGARPFVGNAASLGYKVCHETPVPPSQVEPTRCPAPFDAVVAKALAKSPADRFQTAREFRDALLEAHAEPVRPSLSEQTIINEVVRPVQPAPSAGSSGVVSDPPSASGTTSPPTGWDADALVRVREQLARHLGPLAAVLVKRAASSTTDIDSLYRRLADELTDPAERTQFLSGRREIQGDGTNPPAVSPGAADPSMTSASSTGPSETGQSTRNLQGTSSSASFPPGSGGAGTGAPAGSPPTSEAIEAATRCLAPYLGPIAKVVARRAAEKATSIRQFHALLAENLSDEGERARFLREVSTAGM